MKLIIVGNLLSHGERDGRKETEYLQSGLSGMDDKTKGKPSTGKGKGKPGKG